MTHSAEMLGPTEKLWVFFRFGMQGAMRDLQGKYSAFGGRNKNKTVVKTWLIPNIQLRGKNDSS